MFIEKSGGGAGEEGEEGEGKVSLMVRRKRRSHQLGNEHYQFPDQGCR